MKGRERRAKRRWAGTNRWKTGEWGKVKVGKGRIEAGIEEKGKLEKIEKTEEEERRERGKVDKTERTEEGGKGKEKAMVEKTEGTEEE